MRKTEQQNKTLHVKTQTASAKKYARCDAALGVVIQYSFPCAVHLASSPPFSLSAVFVTIALMLFYCSTRTPSDSVLL